MLAQLHWDLVTLFLIGLFLPNAQSLHQDHVDCWHISSQFCCFGLWLDSLVASPDRHNQHCSLLAMLPSTVCLNDLKTSSALTTSYFLLLSSRSFYMQIVFAAHCVQLFIFPYKYWLSFALSLELGESAINKTQETQLRGICVLVEEN